MHPVPWLMDVTISGKLCWWQKVAIQKNCTTLKWECCIWEVWNLIIFWKNCCFHNCYCTYFSFPLLPAYLPPVLFQFFLCHLFKKQPFSQPLVSFSSLTTPVITIPSLHQYQFPCTAYLPLWRLRWKVPLKDWYLSTKLHGITNIGYFKSYVIFLLVMEVL